jgi:hypothetical protein
MVFCGAAALGRPGTVHGHEQLILILTISSSVIAEFDVA